MLIDSIRNDLNDAVRTQKEPERTTLRGLLAAIRNQEIALGQQSTGLTDEETEKVVNKLIKQRQDSIDAFKAVNAHDRAAKEAAEQIVLRRYVRDQPTVDMLTPVILSSIQANGFTSMRDMGKLLSSLRETFGNVDGKVVKEIAEPIFSKIS